MKINKKTNLNKNRIINNKLMTKTKRNNKVKMNKISQFIGQWLRV